ncbi:hypothetical protein KY284_026415 [Solanum tuberosum]|nr:hypothetical protein KY284_026415 [Solanum tuberosum]
MPRNRSMASLKNSAPSSSSEVHILSLSSNSSDESLGSLSPSSKKRASCAKKKAPKIPRPNTTRSFSPEDMQRFWGIEQKNKSDLFKTQPIVHCRVINLSQFRDFNCLVENKWVKKDCVKARAETIKPTIFFVESAALLLQDNDELKTCILAVERGLEAFHQAVEKVFRLQKETSTDVDKLRIAMTDIKQEGIFIVKKLIQQVDALKSEVSSSNNDLGVTVQTSYSSLSRNVECSYNSFCGKVINTLKYFLADR